MTKASTILMSVCAIASGASCVADSPPPDPEYTPGTCIVMRSALCTTPEGLPYPQTQEEPMFPICGGGLMATPANVGDWVGRMDADLQYDEAGRLQTIAMECGATSPHEYTMSYDEQGRHVRWDISPLMGMEPDGSTIDRAAQAFRLEYEDGVIRRSIFSVDGPGAVERTTAFEYDSAGYLALTTTEEGPFDRYEHDGEGRLLHWSAPYSPNGDWELTFEYEQDQIASVAFVEPREEQHAVASFFWQDGQIVESRQSFALGLETVTRITRDDEGRVIERERSTAGGDLMNRALFEYDEQGRWVHYEWWGYRSRQDYGTDAW